ncbi:neural cell adhesion molecule 2-like isoform X2 [Oscarella lobularis]|uniref:neural cell adhesion molecule 2-like isoform X2 n=1 Tax=Oscarella lobularis TaxID=121494 RepID=UPI003313770A
MVSLSKTLPHALFPGVKAKIAAYINIPRPQKYLVLEKTSKTFLFCNGSSSTNGLRISLSLSRDPANHPKVPFVPLTPGGKSDDHYSVKCTPEMPLDGGFANVSKAFCVLGIANVVTEDAGQYSCQVESSSHSIQAARAQVGVHVYQKFIIDTAESNPKTLDVNETDSVVFKCRINPQNDLLDLIVQWRRSGDVIQSKDSNERSIVGEFDYTLKSVNRKDAGVYQCVVISQNDGAVIIDSGTNTTLDVNFAPIVNIFSRPYFAENHSVLIDYHTADSLNCTAEGYPRPRLIVSRNGYNLRGKQINNTITIKFPSATGYNDGMYCCNASNKLGNRTACLKVRVKMPPKILNLTVTGERNGFLSANAIATLTCQAKGKPPPTVSLYDPLGQRVQVRDPSCGRPVEAVETGLATTFKFNTSLVKEGVYTCFANNSVGNVSSKHTLRLSVVIAFHNVTTLMHANESDGNQQCRPEGSTLCCSATAGNNSLTVRILNSKGKVLNSATGIGEKTCATVTKTGNYSCFAGNQFSNATRFLEEHVRYCSQAAITGTGIGVFALLILLVVTLGVIRCIGRLRSSQRKSTESQPRNETTPLLSSLDGDADVASSLIISQTAEDDADRQIAIVSNIIQYNWDNVFRMIDPPFQDGERFLDSVLKKAKESSHKDSYWAEYCLREWIGENTNSEPKPESSFLHAVHNALLDLEAMDLAEKLYKDFSFLKPNQKRELHLSASYERK